MRVGCTTRKVTALVTIGAAVAMTPATGAAATSPVKPVVSGTAPAAIAPARTVKVRTTLRSTKQRTVRVGLVVASGTGAKGGVALGKGRSVRLRARRTLRLTVSGKLAAGARAPRVGRLLVCIEP